MGTKSFSLIEIILMIVIIGVMVTLALPKLFAKKESANVPEAVTALAALYHAQQMYVLDHPGSFATDCSVLEVSATSQKFSPPVCQNTNPIVSLQRIGGSYTIGVTQAGVFSCTSVNASACAPVTGYLPQ